MPTVAPAAPTAKLPRINDSQVKILQALAKCPPGTGLTRAELHTKTGAAINAGNIGPAFKSVLENYPDSLYGFGLVRPVAHPDSEPTWEATVKGRQLADRYRARKKPAGDKVPGAVIDPVVKKFLPTRTYGLECYTDNDIKDIRAALPADHKDTPLDALRQQIVNRRKQGAYADRADTAKRAAARALKEFGVNGTVIDGLLTDEQCERLEKAAAGE